MKKNSTYHTSADKLSGIIHSLSKSDTQSPNSAMPPPELIAEFAKADATMPSFFQNEFKTQLRHERKMEKTLAFYHFLLRLLEVALPFSFVIALSLIFWETRDTQMVIILSAIFLVAMIVYFVFNQHAAIRRRNR